MTPTGRRVKDVLVGIAACASAHTLLRLAWAEVGIIAFVASLIVTCLAVGWIGRGWWDRR